VTTLRIAECGCRYAASVLADGASPAEARDLVLEMAAEFEMAAEALRRAVRLRPGERRPAARMMAGAGVPVKRIAWSLGVSERTVRVYLNGR
jgi:DNA-binding CsgD family transcriptional regulator